MTFKDNLRTIRKYLHFSQEKLANKIGVSRQSVSKWETGEAYPSMSNILAICEISHCKITDLIDINSEELTQFGFNTKEKKSISQLEKKDQKKLRNISKIIYILMKIARILSLLGFVLVGVVVFVLRFAIANYVLHDFPGDTTTINLFQYNALPKLLLVILIIASTVLAITCLYLVLYNAEKFFKTIYKGSSVFCLENSLLLKRVSKYLLLWTAFDNLPKIVLLLINPSFALSINIISILFSLIALCLAYVFRYGNVLEEQKELS